MDLELGWSKADDKVISCFVGMLALGTVGGDLGLFASVWQP